MSGPRPPGRDTKNHQTAISYSYGFVSEKYRPDNSFELRTSKPSNLDIILCEINGYKHFASGALDPETTNKTRKKEIKKRLLPETIADLEETIDKDGLIIYK